MLKIITIVVPDILIAENANNIIRKFFIIVHIKSTTKSKAWTKEKKKDAY